MRPMTIDEMIERYPGTNRQTWAQHRYRGTGPRFFKVGRKVYYRVEDVFAWEQECTRVRTDEQVGV
ncbi:DNA-binding protein [Corynebacterium sp. H127]|uniref:helix-turn-helix transcriptional regulator n=1 Tax=Corynebacterium sp. H127 TaxID=3133418 RepID=UPI00309EF7B4